MRLKTILAVGALIGCGPLGCGDAEDYDDYGQAEQELTSQANPGLTITTLTGTTDQFLTSGPQACTAASTATCFVPKTRVVSFCVDPNGWANTAERDAVRAALFSNVASMQAQLNGFPLPAGLSNWSLTVAVPGSSCDTLNQVMFTRQTLAPVQGNNMAGYVQLIPQGVLTTLTESLAGTYKSYTGMKVFIDKVDIDARGANATEDSVILQHALTMGAIAALGNGSVPLNNVAGQRTVTPIGSFSAFTTGQVCRTQRWNTASPSTFATTNSSPSCVAE